MLSACFAIVSNTGAMLLSVPLSLADKSFAESIPLFISSFDLSSSESVSVRASSTYPRIESRRFLTVVFDPLKSAIAASTED